MSTIQIRSSQPKDAELLSTFIHQFAEYTHSSDHCIVTPAMLRDHLFGPRPAAEALIAECDGTPAGFAIFFTSFSTFLGKPGFYLEDLFVVPEFRGMGIGTALLLELVAISKRREYGRVEWEVLHWNERAITFYKKLGATPKEESQVYRLSEDDIERLTRDE